MGIEMETEQLIIWVEKLDNGYIRVEIQHGKRITGLLSSMGFYLGPVEGRLSRLWSAASLENLLLAVEEMRCAAHAEGQEIVVANQNTRIAYAEFDDYQRGLTEWA